MKYLSPEIEAFYKGLNNKSLARPTVSCGIFQDCDYSEERPKLFNQQNRKKTKE